jgi:hypothetical protein
MIGLLKRKKTRKCSAGILLLGDGKENTQMSVQLGQNDAPLALGLLRFISCTFFKHLFAHHQEALYINIWYIFVLKLIKLFKIIYVYFY